MRNPAAALVMSNGQRGALRVLSRSQTAAHREVQRARVLLLAADGVANSVIAQSVSVTPTTVNQNEAYPQNTRRNLALTPFRGHGVYAAF